MQQEIVIFGAGGHAKVIVDIIEKQNLYRIKNIIETQPKSKNFMGYEVQSEKEFFENPYVQKGLIAIGDNFIRSNIANKLLSVLPSFKFVVAIHPSAQIAKNVVIGGGTCVMANVAVNTDSQIGEHVILNTNCSVDHDCTLQDFSSVAPNAALGGNCKIGTMSAISIGATVIHGINIGNNTVVGAGATVTRNLEENGLYIGTPAKLKATRTLGQKYL